MTGNSVPRPSSTPSGSFSACSATRAAAPRERVHRRARPRSSAGARPTTSTNCLEGHLTHGIGRHPRWALGAAHLASSYRGWSILVLAPVAALDRRTRRGRSAARPLDADVHDFSASGFLAQFFPIFLLGALFGKLMDDSGSVRSTIAQLHRHERLGARRAILAVVIAGALGDLRRREPVRRVLRAGPDGAGAVPRGEHPAPADAGRDRAGHLHVHDVGACRAPRRSRTRSRCRSSAPRRSRRRGWASSRRSSCWVSACGGWRAPKPLPAAGEKAMATLSLLPMPPQTIRWCANGPRPPAAFDPAEVHHGQHR
jgi:hypothetical protein